MFVQSEKFVAEHASATSPHLRPGIELHDVAARQDEFSGRGIDADIRWNNEGSFHKDELKDLRCDYVLANPCPYRKTKTADRNRESADTAPDERSLQVDLVRLDRTVPVAGCVGGGDPCPSTRTQRAAAQIPEACLANGISAICSILTKNITTRLVRTYRCTRTRRPASHPDCPSHAGDALRTAPPIFQSVSFRQGQGASGQ
jgi:hypothetical protein